MDHFGLPEFGLILFVFIGVAILLLLIPYWQIFKKAGFHPALAILMIFPLVNLVMIYYLAFAEWPSLKKGEGRV